MFILFNFIPTYSHFKKYISELSESRLALKESLCRGTLRTVAALGVGDAHLRGLLLYHLHAALAERARRSPDQYEVTLVFIHGIVLINLCRLCHASLA